MVYLGARITAFHKIRKIAEFLWQNNINTALFSSHFGWFCKISDRPDFMGDRLKIVGDRPKIMGDRLKTTSDRLKTLSDRLQNPGDRH